MKRIILLSFLIFLFHTLAVQSADYYVSTTGSNSNGGTSWGDAFLTIQYAVSIAGSGDRIYVRDDAGTLTEFTGSVQITSAKDGLEIIGSNEDGSRFPVLNGSGASKGFDVQADNVRIELFTIINFTNGGSYSNGEGSGIYTADGTYDHSFVDNKIDNCGWGIYCVNTSNTQILKNQIGNFSGTTATVPGIHYSGGSGGVGVYLLSTGSSMESNIVGSSANGNTIKDCEAFGVKIGYYTSNVSVDMSRVSYNTIQNCGNSTTGGYAIGVKNVEYQLSINNNTLSSNYNGLYGEGTALELFVGSNAFNGTTSTNEIKISNSFDAALTYDIWKNASNTFDGGSCASLHATLNQVTDNADNFRYIRNAINEAVTDAATGERVYINSASYTESITVNKAVTFANSGAVSITGNLEIQSNLSVSGQYTLTGNLTLNGGNLTITNNDFTVTGTITPNSNIVKTTGTGYLAYSSATGSSTYPFPLGNDTYNYPVSITPGSSTSNPIKARLLNQTPHEKRKGDDRLAIGQVWDLSGDASLNATVKFNWQNSVPPQGASFNTANTYAGLGNGASWVEQASNPVRTATSLQIDGVNTFSDMSVFSWTTGTAGYYALQNYPDLQARSIVFTAVTDNSITFQWTNGNGDNVIVVGRQAGNPDSPVNGTAYSGNASWTGGGDTYGSGTKVLFSGTNATSSITVTNLQPATTYYFQVYSFNGSGTQCYYSAEAATYNPRSRATSPNATFNSVLPTTICENGTVNLNMTVVGTAGTNNIKIAYTDGLTNFNNENNNSYSTPFDIVHNNIAEGAGVFSLISVRDKAGKLCTLYGNPQTITVLPKIENNIVSSAQEICTNTTPAGLTGTLPTGGNGSYTYLWESSVTNGTTGFSTASGTSNTQDYTPGVLTASTWYRRTVTSGGCSDVSTAIKITVNPVIANNTVSSAQEICTNTTPAGLTGTLPTGGNGSYTYLWESSTVSGSTGFATADGTSNGQDYTPGVLAQTTWYRRVVNSDGCTNNSNSVQITVSPAISNNTIASDQSICINDVPAQLTGSEPTGGNGTFTYEWLYSTTSASTGFSTAPGTNNSQNYQPVALSQQTWFRRNVTSGGCTNTSSPVAITIKPVIGNNTIGNNQTICYNQTPNQLTGTYPTGGNGTYTFLWESSVTSGTTGFTDASGTNNQQNYSPASLTQDTWFRRKVTSDGCYVYSTAVKITVLPVIANNTVSASQNLCYGDTPVSFDGTTPTGGNGTYTYLWESSVTSSTSGFSAAAGTNNGEDYIPGALYETTWYRRTVTSGGCSDVSTAIKMDVTPVITNNSVSASQTICYNTTPASLTGTTPGGGNGSYTYEWERSVTGNSSGFSTASGTYNLKDYSPGALTTTTWYRRKVSSGYCTNYSSAIEITVIPEIANNTVASDQSICSGSLPSALTGSTPTGGTGSFTYLWESSVTSATSGFGNASGTNTLKDYTPGALTQSTWYRRVVYSGICSVTSSTVKITVKETPADVISPYPSASYCTGNYVTLSTTYSTNYGYQWQKDGANISGANSYTYNANAVGEYRVIITDNTSGCVTTTSQTSVSQSGEMPTVPDQPTASNVKTLSFLVSWNSVNNATGYYIDVATDNQFNNILAAYNNKYVGTNSISIETGVTRNTDYWFRVRSNNGCGTSTSSTSNIAGTLDPVITILSSAPFNLGTVETGSCSSSSGTFTVSATELEANLTVTPPAGFKISTDGTNYNYTNTSPLTLTPNGSGTVSPTNLWVAFCPTATGSQSGNVSGTSTNATTVNFSVQGTGILPTPSQPYASNIKTYQFTMNWTAVTGATGYRVDVATDAGFTNILSSYNNLDVSGATSTVINNGIARNSTYWFRVKAYDGNGTYANSTPNSVTTRDPVITITATEPLAFGDVAKDNCSGSPKTYSVSADALEENLVITPPEHYKLSINGISYNYDYSTPLTLTPDSYGDIASTTIYVEFCPTASGPLNGSINHTSNNATSKTVSLTGRGLLQSPSSQASNIVFSNDGGTSLDLAWTKGDGEKRVVVMRVGGEVTWTPVNGTEYSPGQSLGDNQYVVAIKNNTDSQNSTISSNITASDKVWVKIWEYNGTGESTSYNNTGFTSGSNPNRPVYLDVSNVNNGNSIIQNVQFFVVVDSKDRSGTYVNTTSDLTVTMAYSGGGTVTGTITSGSSSTTIYNTLTDSPGTGKVLTFTGTGYFSDSHTFTLFAAAPTKQSYYVLFDSTKCTKLYMKFYKGNGAKELILYREGAYPSLPVDGTDYSGYSQGTDLGDGTKFGWTGVYANGTELLLDNLTEASTVYVRTFSYNGTGVLTSYNKATSTLNPRYTTLPSCTPRMPSNDVIVAIDGFGARSVRNKVYTQWNTYLETGLVGFELYRAPVDDTTESPVFEKIASYNETDYLKSAGDENGKEYSWVDADPGLITGHLYLYKLKYVGADGQTYDGGEDIVCISDAADGDASMWVSGISPQPARDHIKFILELEDAGDVTVELYEVSGQKIDVPVSNRYYPAGFSEVQVDFDITALASGTYILQVSSGRDVVTKKIVIQK